MTSLGARHTTSSSPTTPTRSTPSYPASTTHWRFPHVNLPRQALADAGVIGDLDPATSTRRRRCSSSSPTRTPSRGPPYRYATGPAASRANCEACEAAHASRARQPRTAAGSSPTTCAATFCRRPSQPNPVDDDRNLVLLRRDLHKLFDGWRFAIVPKRQPTDAETPGVEGWELNAKRRSEGYDVDYGRPSDLQDGHSDVPVRKRRRLTDG